MNIKDKKTLVCIVLTIVLLASNGFWIIQSQSISSENDDLNDQVADLEDKNLVLDGEYLILLSNYQNLTSKHESLESSYSELMGDYNDIREEYSSIVSDHRNLTIQYNAALNKTNNLLAQISSLQSNNTALETSYEELQDDYNQTSNLLDSLWVSYFVLANKVSYINLVTMGSLAHDFYESVRDQFGDSGVSQDGVDFCADLAQNDIGNHYFTNAETSYKSITGTERNEEAKVILQEILELAGVSSSDNYSQRMTKILQFIHSNIDYQHDLDDRCFAPTETLSSGTGDCEDFSTLAAALFELAGIQTAIGTFKNDDGDGHSMVLVRLSDLGGYHYYYYSSLTGYGLSSGKWILIEPQSLISDQADSSWMTQWDIKYAAEV